MPTIEQLYDDHAVRIICNGFEGSGCVVQPLASDFTYIFTAKHCLTETDKCNKEDIKVFRYLETDPIAEVLDVHLHQDLDIAIIVLKRISNLQTTRMAKAAKGSEVVIYGYPLLLKGKAEPRQNVMCRISFVRSTMFEITSEIVQFTFENAMPETIRGLSGSGIFVEQSGSLFLVGVLFKLKGKDGAYSSLCAYDIPVFEKFLVDSKLPPLELDDFSTVSKDYSLLNNVFSISFTSGSGKYYHERTVDAIFKNYLANPKNIWVSGHSGVGKTLLVLRNLSIENKKAKHIDLTCSVSGNIEDYFHYINNEIIAQCSLTLPSTKHNVFEKISDNLCQITNNEDIIIFVDEVPISVKEKFYDFLASFIKVSERYANLNKSNNKVKWIICTRINPTVHLLSGDENHPNKIKAHKNFIFKNFDLWTDDELSSLLELLQSALNFSISFKSANEMIRTSEGLPGRLKSIVERVILEGGSVFDAISMIKSEGYSI
ncbi:trypsin-like serine peptidase [Ohtaekwangia koreensis]|uniref:Trypsin-like peptidase domain-containing protein n=1 Tax=Ohtaekwangia koreensis TaxID=688867 RepID=A0A1T5KPR2_9BACT|nr:trypsin-like peptidase domain-containing protein [Ohtaekwangia koreensis]SKC65744.1 hypothetical protein SAMN05660236_2450 [Ohtaekwangia koreensis]